MVQATSYRLARLCRSVAAGFIASVLRWRALEEIEQALRVRPPLQQAGLVGGVLLTLFVVSLLFASFGLPGFAVFLALVFLLVR